MLYWPAMASPQSVAVVIDYQNVFMTAFDVFGARTAARQSLIDPFRFAERLVEIRNRQIGLRNWRKDTHNPTGALQRVAVFRGLPDALVDPQGHRDNLDQKERWEREGARHGVQLTVTHRPLRYRKRRIASGWVTDPDTPEEKGIDVLCALALTRLARNGDYDVVILASRDTDLIPAVQEAQRSGARIEGTKWFDNRNEATYANLHVGPDEDLWTTPMTREDYDRSLDAPDGS